MDAHAGTTLWIVGTSVSIEDGGYVTRLTQRAQPLGMPIVNLSIGDQTSVMGYMRVLEHCHDIKPADVVVWEYSLLDTLLTESLFPADDVHAARKMTWQCILERDASVIVLLAAPKKHLLERSACEANIARDAASLGLPCIDTRELFSGLGIRDATSHYRDDRHLLHDSPVILAIVDAVLRHALSPSRPNAATLSAWARKNINVRWQWLGSETLAAIARLPARTFRNSLMTIEAIPLAPDAGFAVPTNGRIVGVAIVSTHDSGGIWCGHPDCKPASTRLPAKRPFSFLLRTTAIPCVHRRISSLASATEYAYERGVWADYGQELCSSPGEVAVFGLLCETQSTARAKLKALWHFYRQQLRAILRSYKKAASRKPPV